MGDSLARRWRWLGTYYAWRNRGRDMVQTIEPWIKIAMGGAFLSGYLPRCFTLYQRLQQSALLERRGVHLDG